MRYARRLLLAALACLVLAAAAQAAGLAPAEARDVIASGGYAEEVRAAERHWHANGISAVPAVIVNDRYLISGGQPAAAFEQALRTIAAELAEPAAT